MKKENSWWVIDRDKEKLWEVLKIRLIKKEGNVWEGRRRRSIKINKKEDSGGENKKIHFRRGFINFCEKI